MFWNVFRPVDRQGKRRAVRHSIYSTVILALTTAMRSNGTTPNNISILVKSRNYLKHIILLMYDVKGQLFIPTEEVYTGIKQVRQCITYNTILARSLLFACVL
jgi:hypothetical protein